MGTWGPGLYQNDLSNDVKTFFRDQLHRGKTGKEITQILIEEYGNELADPDDAVDFWCALADTQWELGTLTAEVKQKALECIDSEHAFARWNMESASQVRKRQQVLDKLREKIQQPQPAEKKIKQYKLYQCPWQKGDVFALPFEGENAKHAGLCGQFLLIEKADHRIWYPGHTIPVVYLRITRNGNLPRSIEEYNQLEFIRDEVISQSIRFIYDRNNDDRPNAAQADECTPDANGNLSIYRIGLITTSTRVLPRNLFFVGNYGNAVRPPREVVKTRSPGPTSYFWKELINHVLDCIKMYGTVCMNTTEN